MLLLPLHCCSATQLRCSARTAAELTSLRRLTVRAEVNSAAVRAEAQCGEFVSFIFGLFWVCIVWIVLPQHVRSARIVQVTLLFPTARSRLLHLPPPRVLCACA